MSFTDLPLTSDLLKPHSCHFPTGAAVCTCQHIHARKSKPLVPDKRLLRWEEWMQRRRHLHQKLKQLLQRDPGTLVMNSGEGLRAVREKKLALEYTKILQPDPQRGCPSFWKMPVELKGEPASCFAIMPKEEKCEIPVIEHVGLPRQIMAEKDILPYTRSSRVLWDNSTYVQEKSATLSHKLKLVDPHEPSFDRLIITGTSICKSIENKQLSASSLGSVPKHTKKAFKLEHSPERDHKPSVLCLSVNNFQLSPHLNIVGMRKVYVFFDYDVTTQKVAKEYIVLKNDGTTTIRFYWKVSEEVELFKDIIREKSHEICFYFNKNEGLIIPGQTIMFPVWFETKNPGTYSEHWEFYTKPRIMPSRSKLVVVFHASAEVGDLTEKMDLLRQRLHNNVRERVIKESLSAVMANISYEKYKPVTYSYNKKEIFEAVNSKFDPVHRLPRYLYNREVVRELQEFYKRVRRETDPTCWNYRIDELKFLTKAKEKEEEHLQTLRQQQKAAQLKSSFSEHEEYFADIQIVNGQPVLIQKKASECKSDIPELSDKADTMEEQEVERHPEPLTQQLEIILAKLEQPSAEPNPEQHIHAKAYCIFCTHLNKLCVELEDLKEKLGVIKITKYPIIKVSPKFYDTPTRFVYENFPNDAVRNPPLTEKCGSILDQPPPECLKDIPLEDYKRRYRAYYDLPDTPPPEESEKKGKKKGKGKDKKGKGKDKKEDTKSNKQNKQNSKKDDKKSVSKTSEELPVTTEIFEDKGMLSNLPRPDEFIEVEQVQKFKCNFDELSPVTVSQYKYNLYIIVYNCLEKAIMEIFDMIEMEQQDKLPLSVIKEIEEEKYYRRLIDLKGLLAEAKADRLNERLIVQDFRSQSIKDWKQEELRRQLSHAQSDSSLWSILKTYKPKPKLSDFRPISYPIDHYESTTKLSQDASAYYSGKAEEPPVMVNVSTSTLDGRLDPNWQDFKDVAIQKDYREGDEIDDLEAYIEKMVRATSVQDLIDRKFNKETQKTSEEHVSDEEYFYASESDFSLVSGPRHQNACGEGNSEVSDTPEKPSGKESAELGDQHKEIEVPAKQLES